MKCGRCGKEQVVLFTSISCGCNDRTYMVWAYAEDQGPIVGSKHEHLSPRWCITNIEAWRQALGETDRFHLYRVSAERFAIREHGMVPGSAKVEMWNVIVEEKL